MSIIIRLQNLPLSAKSEDIRRFFGGLHIPNGGVHIVGGNDGDAFIAFTTDEDARLAMRKDGGKILDARVKLYLSSRVEMQKEIGRITEEDDEDSNVSHQGSPFGRQVSIRGPLEDRNVNYSRSYHANSPSRRGRSPEARSRSPRRRSRSPRRKSRSPRKRSRSPMMPSRSKRSRSPRMSSRSKRSRSPMMSSRSKRSMSPMMSSESRRSRSPIKRTFVPSTGQRSMTPPHRSDVGSSLFSNEKDRDTHRDGKLVDVEMLFGLSKGSSNWNYLDFPRREENTLLEQKFAEALNASLSSIGKMYHSPSVNEHPVNMHGERIGEPAVNLHGGRFVEPGLNIQGGRVIDTGVNIQGGRTSVPGMNIQGRAVGDLGMNIQGGRFGDPGMNLQGGRFGDPGMNIQGGRIGGPSMNIQGGRIDGLGMNIQGERISDHGMDILGGRIGDQGMNIQGGRIMNPGMNIQGGRIGDPGINIQGGRIGDPGMNIQGGRIGDPGMQGGRMGDLGINMPAVRQGEHFSNLNPNAMPFQPEYNNPGLREMPVQENNRLVFPNMHPSSNMNMLTNFNPSVQPLQYPPPMSMPPRVNLPPTIPISTMPPPSSMPPSRTLTAIPLGVNEVPPLKGNFVTLSGLDPLWNVNDLQNMLKGVFVPSKNVRWELDNKLVKTGTAFINIYNISDFKQLVSFPTYSYNSRIITVNECPEFLVRKYFAPEIPSEGSLNSLSGDFYHKMQGLPYEANYDNVLNFFAGLEVNDLYIIYSKNSEGFRIQGKATGIAFIAFGNTSDCAKAMAKNGQCFGLTKRFIKIENSSRILMLEAKEKNFDLLSQSTTFVRAYSSPKDVSSDQNQPVCALLTGLPQNVSPGKIIGFFKGAQTKLGNIHILDKEKLNPRAFVEFANLRDFLAALSRSGKKMNNHIVFMKQISYEEMMECVEPGQKNSFKNAPQNPHSYSHSSTETFLNRSDPGKHSTLEGNYRPGYNSGKNIQVFEYGNKSREPITVPNTASNHSLTMKKPLKPCLKNSNSSYREDQNSIPPSDSWPPSDLPLKSDVHKPNETLHIEESGKPEASFGNVVHKSNQSTHSGGFKKLESIKNEVITPKKSVHSGEAIQHKSSVADKAKNAENNYSKLLFKDGVKDPELSTDSKVSSQTEIDKEAIKMETDEESRTPVKFEVKIKPAISKSVKVEDAFDNADTKKKLSKLSPERVLAVSVKLPATDEKYKSAKGTENTDKKVDAKSNDKKVEAKKSEDNKNAKDTDDDKSLRTKSTNDDKIIKTKSTDDKNVKTKSNNDKNVKTKSTDDRNVKTKSTDGKNFKPKSTDDDKNGRNKKTEADKNVKTKISDSGKNFKSHESASKPKSKSPDMKKSEKGKSIEVGSCPHSRYSQSYQSGNKTRERNRSNKNRETRRRSPVRSDARRRPISRSPISRSRSPRSIQPSYPSEILYTHEINPANQMAIVQLCNVDPVIGSAELLHFFYEFDVDADKIIRRIDDHGLPTGDVRVTFRNRRVAEVAIRNLNGSYLNGLSVSMFHVD